MLRCLILAAAFLTSVQVATAQASQTWTQVGILTCKLNPRIGFVIFGHQFMECRLVQNPPLPTQLYEGALNTVGADLGITAGGVLGCAVLAPTAGPPPGALTYGPRAEFAAQFEQTSIVRILMKAKYRQVTTYAHLAYSGRLHESRTASC